MSHTHALPYRAVAAKHLFSSHRMSQNLLRHRLRSTACSASTVVFKQDAGKEKGAANYAVNDGKLTTHADSSTCDREEGALLKLPQLVAEQTINERRVFCLCRQILHLLCMNSRFTDVN